MMWQLIDTAPKDGTRVLLFVPEYENKPCFGYYEDWESRSYGVVVTTLQGWTVDGKSHGCALPTHWMPLGDPE